MAKKKETIDRAKKRAMIIQNYKRTFLEGAGKSVLLDLIKAHHVMGPLIDENPIMMAHSEGERNVILRILRIMETDAEALLLRLREAEAQENIES